jgi:hypothetical protein
MPPAHGSDVPVYLQWDIFDRDPAKARSLIPIVLERLKKLSPPPSFTVCQVKVSALLSTTDRWTIWIRYLDYRMHVSDRQVLYWDDLTEVCPICFGKNPSCSCRSARRPVA